MKGGCGGDVKLRLRIVKLPPEARDLANKLEDTLSSMVSDTVQAMVGVDNDLENFEITVQEEVMRQLRALGVF
tara:strand:+ start:4913 stop:5131 length:219 start_codon:yes stop_codon:yes gene_type:complete